jgi:hypothetical protein
MACVTFVMNCLMGIGRRMEALRMISFNVAKVMAHFSSYALFVGAFIQNDPPLVADCVVTIFLLIFVMLVISYILAFVIYHGDR